MITVLLIAFAVMAICVIFHTLGLSLLAGLLLGRRTELRQMSIVRHMLALMAVFGGIVLLHMIEAGFWATFYQLWGLFPDFETSLYFSLTSYTTIGFGDVTLPQRWRLFGGIEGVSGVLLCGLSTAFLFVILNLLLETDGSEEAAPKTSL